MSDTNRVSRASGKEPGSLLSYISGFVLSVGFTLAAYFAVVDHWAMGWTLAIILLVLAVVQFIVQMVFFLHIASEKKPRDRQTVMWMMIVIVLVVVVGSVWIMWSLNQRMMPTSAQMENYMNSQAGL